MTHIGIDPGSLVSGICVLREGGVIIGSIVDNSLVVSLVEQEMKVARVTVVIEDIINPYTIRLRPEVITTCKFIGLLQYRLSLIEGLIVVNVERHSVRRWLYGRLPGVVIPLVEKRIAYLDESGKRNDRKRYVTRDGSLRSPTFVFVDDRIVIAAMKYIFQIPTPKPGKSNLYGLKSHSWQALALLAYFKNL